MTAFYYVLVQFVLMQFLSSSRDILHLRDFFYSENIGPNFFVLSLLIIIGKCVVQLLDVAIFYYYRKVRSFSYMVNFDLFYI